MPEPTPPPSDATPGLEARAREVDRRKPPVAQLDRARRRAIIDAALDLAASDETAAAELRAGLEGRRPEEAQVTVAGPEGVGGPGLYDDELEETAGPFG